MKVLIDACVLYPTVLRRIVLGAAGAGAFTPLWSARILEEWARAADRNGVEARPEVALLRADWPDAEVAVRHTTQTRLSLPDPDDLHVLAAAIDGGADEVLTLNLKDFPTQALSAEGLIRRHPDEFLLEVFHDGAVDLLAIVRDIHADAQRMAGVDLALRAVLKKSRLPRLGKALDDGAG
jgi:hypothetical protein